jgi:hypothetical protein
VITIEGVLQPNQQLTYVHLPFEVPANIGRIDVAYSYDAEISSDPELTGGNTVDIGIFDPRGIDFCTEGYRGWSGSARKSFFIAQNDATPGYMPGEIQPGTWHICLGVYKVAADGCRYQVNISLTPSEESAFAFPELLRLSDTPSERIQPDGWYKGEIHCHTVHSDGDSTPGEIVQLAESLGLDFLAITDHNNRTQGIDLARIKTNLILIPGYEVTTYYGHWNIWGDNGWIDFRVQQADDLARAVNEANARGFLMSCNHPKPYGPDWAYPEVEGYSCVEVWNGPWEGLNPIALEFWEARLRRGKRLTAVGGSDHHFSWREHPAKLAHPTNYIYCPGKPSAVELLRALRAGHAFISESPLGPQLFLAANNAIMGDQVARPTNNQVPIQVQVVNGIGAHLQVFDASGVITQIEVNSVEAKFDFTVNVAETPYIRIQLVHPETGYVSALTNPIYIA